MKLLTEEIKRKLPRLYSTESKTNDEKVVQVKFFALGSGATWYGIEFDGKDTFFGYCTGLAEDEFGYFSLNELAALRYMGIPRVERDLYFKPCPVSDVINGKVR